MATGVKIVIIRGLDTLFSSLVGATNKHHAKFLTFTAVVQLLFTLRHVSNIYCTQDQRNTRRLE